jgi:uncharacterized protein (TIGR02266 family)
MGTEVVSNKSDAQSFQKFRARLAAVADPLPPVMDANATALRALVVADWMAQPEARAKLHAAARNGAFDPRCIDEMRDAARAIVFVVSKLPDQAASKSGLTGSLRDEAQRLRRSIADRMAPRLDKDEDAAQWLALARSGQNDAELLLDLRTLMMLFRDQPRLLQSDANLKADVERATHLEPLLAEAVGGEKSGEWQDWLARGWTLLANLFERVNRVGRDVLSDVPGMTFPSLAVLARAQRQHKSREPSTTVRARPKPDAKVEVTRAHRLDVELQVDILSDSNFYAGFTENVSAEGIFVATHVLQPIGSIVEMSVQFPGQRGPVRVRGEVRWVREYSQASDACPGMGIRFEQLSPADDLLVREFLAKREPLFFDE